jgi:hypothetical protein
MNLFTFGRRENGASDYTAFHAARCPTLRVRSCQRSPNRPTCDPVQLVVELTQLRRAHVLSPSTRSGTKVMGLTHVSSGTPGCLSHAYPTRCRIKNSPSQRLGH